jgi:hypothetical protein
MERQRDRANACALMIPADSMAEFEDQVEWFARTVTSSALPGIDDLDPAIGEVGNVAGRYGGTMSAGNRGDLGVECRDRPPEPPSPGANLGIGICGAPIELQDAAFEIFSEEEMRSLGERRASFAGWQQSDTEQHLGFGDRRGKQ